MAAEQTAARLREVEGRAEVLDEELAAARAGLVAAQAQAAATAETGPATAVGAVDPMEVEERVAAGVAARAAGGWVGC